MKIRLCHFHAWNCSSAPLSSIEGLHELALLFHSGLIFPLQESKLSRDSLQAVFWFLCLYYLCGLGCFSPTGRLVNAFCSFCFSSNSKPVLWNLSCLPQASSSGVSTVLCMHLVKRRWLIYCQSNIHSPLLPSWKNLDFIWSEDMPSSQTYCDQLINFWPMKYK